MRIHLLFISLFDPVVIEKFVTENHNLFILCIFTVAFSITYYLIPKVLYIVKERDIYKPVIGRSAHSKKTPTLAGVAFFTTYVLVISILQSFHNLPTGNHLIAALTVMFMVGLKDDLVVSSARVKLIGELLATGFIVFSPQMQIESLHGFMGIDEIPGYVGNLIAAFIMISLINAYNLIDGINGLAGIIGIVICSVYAFIFAQIGSLFFLSISLMVVGVLIAYLRYNFALDDTKIFMGDSGSLTIGLLIGFLTIKVLGFPEYIPGVETEATTTSRVLLIMAILFVPIFDTARVILVRMLKGISPFEPDNNHIHHVLLSVGLDHKKAATVLGLLNILVVSLFILLSKYLTNISLFASLLLMYTIIYFLFQALDKHPTQQDIKKNNSV